ncbi:hypothetical protein GGH19_003497 [Coemansia sp. RSA 1807]|nr:hypothetical protein LPJ62_000998 [Coemansia sp. RSA 2167]KAJ2154032.1 hypothetical protein J3F82_001527 [Coemansia sp. RSA 637]KAJ2536488.1 hypothetical protein IWW43_000809 [Coemansia sp. RSA 1935]KAJ2574827.1 hypothetical protein GGH19_003497 [Coemansia sp. RSA 1807]
MVLKPIKRAVVPSPLSDAHLFDDFVTQYFNKCDDLLSYTQRYPVIKQTPTTTVQRQNRNPHESHRWLRRTTLTSSYDHLKTILFVSRFTHMPKWMPHMLSATTIESIVPNLCDIVHLSFTSPGLKARRDYCQLVMKREFVGEMARHKPRVFTPSASVANLAQVYCGQSSASLADLAVSPHMGTAKSVVDLHDMSRDPSPYGHVRAASARNLEALVPPPLPTSQIPTSHSYSNSGYSNSGYSNQAYSNQPYSNQPYSNQPTQYAGLNTQHSPRSSSSESAEQSHIVRRFQIVSVPVQHTNCTPQRGFVRAVSESYEEIREYADGRVEWVCIHHSDFSGWVPSFMADHSIATAFPKEADALLDYIRS